jgi:hypothetical protein
MHPRRVEPSSMLLGKLQILQAFFFYKIKNPGNKTGQDNKCLQIRRIVQQLAIDMYQRLLSQG